MKLMKRATAMFVGTTMLVGMLAGCAGKPTEVKDAGKDNSSSEEEITLRFSWWGGDSRHEATLACIEAFEKKYPNIKIEAEYSGFDGYQDKISAALSGRTEPDIIQLDQPWMPTFLAHNPDFFLDFHEYEDIFSLDGFSEDFLADFCEYEGKLVSVPTGTNALQFLANKAVLEEAGIEFSDVITWDDLYEQGKKVNETNPEKYFLNIDGGGITGFISRIYLEQMTNRQLINMDYTVGVTVDELEEAFAYVKKLIDDKVLIPYEEAMIFKGAPQDNPKWNNNQLGGWLNWASQSDQQQWGEDAVTLPYPSLEGAENSGILVRPSQVMVVSSQCEHPEAAMKFLDFMFNQEEGILALKDCRSIPPTEKGRQILGENGLISEQASLAVDLAMQDPGTPECDVPNTTEVMDAYGSVIEKMIYGQYESPRAAAEDAYQLMSEMLDTVKADME